MPSFLKFYLEYKAKLLLKLLIFLWLITSKFIIIYATSFLLFMLHIVFISLCDDFYLFTFR